MKLSIIFKLFFGFIIIGYLYSCKQNSKYKTYYFSNTGDNNNSGISKNNPWKDINKLDSIAINPGDKILLQCGDVFTGNLNLGHSGTSQHPIKIASYGKGLKPVLKGSVTIHDYKKDTNNLVTFKSSRTIKNVFVDNKMLVPARFPNSGFLRIDRTEKKIGILYDHDLPHKDEYWNNARLVYRSTEWTYDWEYIKRHQNNTLYYDTLNLKYPVQKNYGYFLDHKYELLDTAGEYYYEMKKNICKLYPPHKNISKINGVIYDYGIYLADSVSNINIHNIRFEQYHKAGVFGKSNNKNIHISDCKFRDIEKAGIRFRSNALSCKIENNEFNHIAGRGISITNSSKCSVINNRVHCIGLTPGLGIHGVNGMTGILIEAIDETRNPEFDIKNYQSDSNYIGLNRIDSCGYNGIRVDGKYNIIEKNIIRNAMLKLNYGGGIYSYERTSNSTFQHNFISNVFGNNESTAQIHDQIAVGIYMDGTINCTVKNNTSLNNKTGILLNSDSKNCQCTGNIMYGNTQNQFSIASAYNPFSENHTIEYNTFFCTDTGQYCMIQKLKCNDPVFGTFDNNIYCDPYSDYIIMRIWRIQDLLTLKKWQSIIGEDMNSSACKLYDPNTFGHKLFYNKSNKNIDIHLHVPYFDLNGDKYSHLELEPFSSKILIFKKH